MKNIELNALAQVGFIVKDVEAVKGKFAELFGVPVPPTIDGGEYEITQTQYKGEAAPDANCLMAFFDLDNGFQIELIQPNEHPSVWRDFLEEKGEGLHHIAFRMKGMKENIAVCENFGMTLVQKGEYGNGAGRYAYLDGEKDLKCMIELLEDD
ncbi:MAG: VOC family protein [Clostridium sp.]|nr:VOC family protein [Clostridium sp.]